MTKQTTCAAWLAAAFFAACHSGGGSGGDAQQPTARARRANVLFIAVDDLRPELGCYGASHAVTPSMDRLAAEGVLFERAYCQSAVCNPSRASLLAGKRPSATGVLDLGTELRSASPDIVTMPQYFRAHGYHTVSVGKIEHNIFPDEPSWAERHYVEGFPFDPDAVYVGEEGMAIQAERVAKWEDAGQLERRKDQFGHVYVKAQATEAPDVPDSAYYDGAQTDWAVGRIQELAESETPWFFGVGYYRPHLPFNAPKRYWDLYDGRSLPEPTGARVTEGAPPMSSNNLRELRGYSDFGHLGHPSDSEFTDEEHRLLRHGYLASVSYVDAQVGRLLAALEKAGELDNTIIVLFGDHGWKLGDHGSYGKMTNFEVDTRVPLIVRAPGQQVAGGRSQALVEFVDIFPALTELAGLPTPTDLEGDSFVPLLTEPTAPWKTAAFSEYLREGIWMGPSGEPYHGRAIRTDRYRYVEWRSPGAPSGEGAGRAAGVELYDLVNDPAESRNLADEPGYRAIAEDHRRRLAMGWTSERAPMNR